MTERLDAFQCQCPTSDNHDTLDQAQTRQYLLLIGNGTQCCHSCQVHPRASEGAGACCMGQKQTIIDQLLSADEQYCMFLWLSLYYCVSHALDKMVLV